MYTISHIECLFRHIGKASGIFKCSTLLHFCFPNELCGGLASVLRLSEGGDSIEEQEGRWLGVLALSHSNSVTLGKGKTSNEFVFPPAKNGHKSGEGPGFLGVKTYTIWGICLRKRMQNFEYKLSYKI